MLVLLYYVAKVCQETVLGFLMNGKIHLFKKVYEKMPPPHDYYR